MKKKKKQSNDHLRESPQELSNEIQSSNETPPSKKISPDSIRNQTREMLENSHPVPRLENRVLREDFF